MAYLDLAFDLPRTALSGTVVPPRHDMASHLGPLERQVVQLARFDGRDSLRAPGRLRTVLAWLFGGTRANGLADARLEALRRYAVMFRLAGEALPQAETEQLVRAGFVREAVDEIRQHVRNAARLAA